MIKSQFYKLFTSVSVFHICLLQVYPTRIPLHCLLQIDTVTQQIVNMLIICIL